MRHTSRRKPPAVRLFLREAVVVFKIILTLLMLFLAACVPMAWYYLVYRAYELYALPTVPVALFLMAMLLVPLYRVRP